MFLLFVVFSVMPHVWGQDAAPEITGSLPEDLAEVAEDAPAWLLRSWGRASRLDRDLTNAFLLLTRSLEKDPNNPETLTELALTYSASNDFFQAREHLQRALENRALLSSPDLEFLILYRLADIYEQNNLEGSSVLDYERILLEVTSRDSQFSSSEDFEANLRRSIREVLLTPGRSGATSLDRMITLYRLEDSFSLRAHILLGEFYVHSGRYNEALEHLTFAVIKMYSLVIEKIRENDPLYAFQSSADLFERIQRNNNWVSYLRDSMFPKALYYLGAAAFGFQSAPQIYSGIWRTVQMIPFEHSYELRSAAMLRNPRREEILYGSRQFRDEVNNNQP